MGWGCCSLSHHFRTKSDHRDAEDMDIPIAKGQEVNLSRLQKAHHDHEELEKMGCKAIMKERFVNAMKNSTAPEPDLRKYSKSPVESSKFIQNSIHKNHICYPTKFLTLQTQWNYQKLNLRSP